MLDQSSFYIIYFEDCEHYNFTMIFSFSFLIITFIELCILLFYVLPLI